MLDSLSIPFKEQVELFSKCSHFISVESGAVFSNIIFMKSDAKIMNILTRTDFSELNDRSENYDSWQVRFGGKELIQEFNIESKAEERVVCTNETDHDMHDHVIIDNKLKNDILTFLQSPLV